MKQKFLLIPLCFLILVLSACSNKVFDSAQKFIEKKNAEKKQERMNELFGQRDESLKNIKNAIEEQHENAEYSIADGSLTIEYYDYVALLKDVTHGKTINGITTKSQATGEAFMTFGNDVVNKNTNTFNFKSQFNHLPTPQGEDFYETWFINSKTSEIVSYEKLEADEFGNYWEISLEDTDYTPFDTYMVTLEVNDGNTAPGEHILEGNFVKVKNRK